MVRINLQEKWASSSLCRSIRLVTMLIFNESERERLQAKHWLSHHRQCDVTFRFDEFKMAS